MITHHRCVVIAGEFLLDEPLFAPSCELVSAFYLPNSKKPARRAHAKMSPYETYEVVRKELSARGLQPQPRRDMIPI